MGKGASWSNVEVKTVISVGMEANIQHKLDGAVRNKAILTRPQNFCRMLDIIKKKVKTQRQKVRNNITRSGRITKSLLVFRAAGCHPQLSSCHSATWSCWKFTRWCRKQQWYRWRFEWWCRRRTTANRSWMRTESNRIQREWKTTEWKWSWIQQWRTSKNW